MRDKISVGQPRHLTSAEALAMCQDRRGKRVISDACAVTIASYWQAPGGHGYAFAQLASTGTVETHALADDIHYAYTHEAPNEDDKLMLDMLSTWRLNGGDNGVCGVTANGRPCLEPEGHFREGETGGTLHRF